MNKIGFFYEVDIKLKEEKKMIKVASKLLRKEKVKNAELNIIIVDNENIQKVNREHRKIDKVTDVISFALEDDYYFVSDKIRLLGDIYISIEKARSQAEDYNHSVKRELAFLTAHGVLHLLGYDHMNQEDEDIMFAKQEGVLNELKIKR